MTTNETASNNRWLRNGIIFITCMLIGVPLLIIGVVYGLIFKFHYAPEQGHHYKGMQGKYYHAMEAGNGEEAVKWAQKIDEYWTAKDRYKPASDAWPVLGEAYELNGELEKSLAAYEDYDRKIGSAECLLYDLAIARVFYKQNRLTEAFEQYCRYGDWCLVQYQEQLADKEGDSRNRTLAGIRYSITMEDDRLRMRLSPFLVDKDFLDFMEKEYAGLGMPEEHAEAMELFRAMDREIDEALLPGSKASDELDAMRNRIIEERAQTKPHNINNGNTPK